MDVFFKYKKIICDSFKYFSILESKFTVQIYTKLRVHVPIHSSVFYMTIHNPVFCTMIYSFFNNDIMRNFYVALEFISFLI